MRIWLWLKALYEILDDLCTDILRLIVGWFILGGDCEHCKHYKYNHAFGSERCTHERRFECQESIIYKHFEKK